VKPHWQRSVGVLVLGATLVSFVVGGVGPFSMRFFASYYQADARTAAGREVLASIPAEASVQAPDVLLPHLAERQTVHRAPPPERNVDFWVLDVSHRDRYAGRSTLLRTSEEPRVRAFMARADRGVLLYRPPFVVLERGLDPRAALAAFEDTADAGEHPPLPLTGCLAITHATALAAGTVRLHLRASGPCPTDLALRLGPPRRAARVELLFHGAVSPAQLRAGDRLVTDYAGVSAHDTREGRFQVGALRSSGARPEPGDPTTVSVPLQ